MKRFYSLIVAIAMLFPMVSFAVPTPTPTPTPTPGPVVKLSNAATLAFGAANAQILNLGTYVCKTQTCDVHNPNDWFNYSSTSTTDTGSGEGSTLIVAPGDTVTFLTEVKYTAYNVSYDSEGGVFTKLGTLNTEASFYPELTVGISNASYLEGISYYDASKGNDNLDGDDVKYQIDAPKVNVTFDNPLVSGNSPQLGIITAKVKAGTPEGTTLSAKLAFDDAQLNRAVTNNLFAKTAYADEVAQSDVKIVVRNPQVATVSAVLPKTGISEKAQGYDYLISMVVAAIAISFLGYELVRRKRSQAK